MERKFEFLMNSWKKESLGGKIAIAFVIISAIVAPFMIIPDIISFFDSFEQFMDVVIGLFVLNDKCKSDIAYIAIIKIPLTKS